MLENQKSKTDSSKTAIIIGAGPAGLTAALELLNKTPVKPIIFEATNDIGGIAKTVNFKGNRIDIGGHRFFSKSQVVMDWWQEIMPLQGAPGRDDKILKKQKPFSKEANAPDPEKTDLVMLIRERLSRIYFLRKFFSYPVSLSFDTFKNLGLWRVMKVGFSYLRIRLFPIRQEKSLEDFFINRFGKELYLTFFKDYTEKVWGLPTKKIKADWGAQRIKGVSMRKVLAHAVKNSFKKDQSLNQEETETSLIGQFIYPKHGPGQLWETVAKLIKAKGGVIHKNKKILELQSDGKKITAVTFKNQDGSLATVAGDYFISTMPIKDLVQGLKAEIPKDIQAIARGLHYRSFVTVGLLVKELKIKNETKQRTINNLVPDNWIYIQERDVKLGRLQIFNNWSPYLIADPRKVWLGLEYFCNEGDEFWQLEDQELIKLGEKELEKIGILNPKAVLDGVVIRVPKTYPAYFGTYEEFPKVQQYLDQFKNLFLVGRNGMHRYNNMDHSMLTAMAAVKNIQEGITSKTNLWQINADEEYHEQK